MQINLSDDVARIIEQKAAAAGFAGQIDAYVAHLIAYDEIEFDGAPRELTLTGKNREEVEAMITAGIESGPATRMNADDWRRLHESVDERSQASS